MRQRLDVSIVSDMIRHDLTSAIINFPCFRSHRLSELPTHYRKNWSKNWIAIASLSGRRREWLVAKAGFHNPIIFADDWLCHAPNTEWVELVVIHEVAHFMAQDINPTAPCHGFLWGRCYSILAGLVGFDQIEMFEVIDHILECSRSELRLQVKLDGCKSYSEWASQILSQQQNMLNWLERRNGEPIDYAELLSICRKNPTSSVLD